ncbi:hypothetical protein SAMN05421805_1011746 [Saccharopolyspora antimicrobica]|uniref:Tetratricopeptide repeat-containing protein n=1 Tax=Saccharopolyspora antimicrobica TaxID=455193 RepID=A0A1I4U6T2_9PSEU|nr:hypothetical protein [Saccharopolyspora antimicrobica]RKT88705.1 hypothetical protein ATL45_7144 [Saccharopolyspora antimicrobica]SFM84541.1 hypothetical protein SAMN05421805_1011746 [Saccharopolyspora antimicrobica]
MSETVTEIERLLDDSEMMPYGPEESAMVADAVRLAQEAGEEELLYKARMRQISSASMTGDSDTMFTAFSWCLGQHDSDPARFPLEVEDNDLLWYYKWMAEAVALNPAFPQQQVDQVLDDMERRYRAAGVGLSGVWQAKMSNATTAGRFEEAAGFRAAREELPRDNYSHCEACVRSDDADYFRASGDEETALRLFDEIIENRVSCGSEPERAQGNALLPLLRAGRADEAKWHHFRSYRAAVANADGFGIISDHLVFLAVTGNTERGLSLLERHIGELPNDPLDVYKRFCALVSYGVLLDAVTRGGHGDVEVRGSDMPDVAAVFGIEPRRRTAAELAAESWRVAGEIAESFDARNGNQHFATEISRARALADEHYDLPIETQTFAPADLAEPEAPKTPADYLDLIRVATVVKEDPAEALALLEEMDEQPEPELLPRFHRSVLTICRERDDWDGAREAIKSRAEALRALGQQQLADVEEELGLALYPPFDDDSEAKLRAVLARDDLEPAARSEVLISLGGLLGYLDQTADAVPLAREAVELAESAGLEQLTSARFLLAQVLLRESQPEPAIDALDALLAAETDRSARIKALELRARVAGGMSDFATGVRVADELLDLQTAIGNRAGVSSAAMLAAHLLDDLGDAAEAVNRAQVAVRHAELGDTGDLNVNRYWLGRFQLQAGEPDLAMESLDAAAAGFAGSEGAGAFALEARFWLGLASREAQELGTAYRVFSEVAHVAEESGDEALVSLAIRAHSALGDLLVSVDDEDAVESFEAALRLARAHELPEQAARVLHQLGQSKIKFRGEAGLADLDAAIEAGRAAGEDWENGPEWFVADVTDTKARALAAMGREEEAIPLALTAADGYAAAHDTGSAAMSELLAARVLNDKGRAEEAVGLYRASLQRLPVGSQAHTGVSLEFGEVLEKLGRATEAAEVRAAVAE